MAAQTGFPAKPPAVEALPPGRGADAVAPSSQALKAARNTPTPSVPTGPAMSSFRDHVLRRFEFYVAALAVAFVWLAVVLVRTEAPTALTLLAAVAGLTPILAAIQWADRERQRRLRAQAIAEIREMLTDQVINQLAAVRMWLAEDPDPQSLALLLSETDASIDRVAAMINGLSEEQLDTWRLTYANVADHVAFSSTPDFAPA